MTPPLLLRCGISRQVARRSRRVLATSVHSLVVEKAERSTGVLRGVAEL
jgi:hypothetical protein